jgi:hypothetical protein
MATRTVKAKTVTIHRTPSVSEADISHIKNLNPITKSKAPTFSRNIGNVNTLSTSTVTSENRYQQINKSETMSSKRKLKQCELGARCPYIDEYQHSLEYSHEENKSVKQKPNKNNESDNNKRKYNGKSNKLGDGVKIPKVRDDRVASTWLDRHSDNSRTFKGNKSNGHSNNSEMEHIECHICGNVISVDQFEDHSFIHASEPSHSYSSHGTLSSNRKREQEMNELRRQQDEEYERSELLDIIKLSKATAFPSSSSMTSSSKSCWDTSHDDRKFDTSTSTSKKSIAIKSSSCSNNISNTKANNKRNDIIDMTEDDGDLKVSVDDMEVVFVKQPEEGHSPNNKKQKNSGMTTLSRGSSSDINLSINNLSVNDSNTSTSFKPSSTCTVSSTNTNNVTIAFKIKYSVCSVSSTANTKPNETVVIKHSFRKDQRLKVIVCIHGVFNFIYV